MLMPLTMTIASYLLGTCGLSSACVLHAPLEPFARVLFEPLFLLGINCMPVMFIIPGMSHETYRTWMRFVSGCLLLSVMLMVLVPVSPYAWLSPFPNPTNASLGLCAGAIISLACLRSRLRSKP